MLGSNTQKIKPEKPMTNATESTKEATTKKAGATPKTKAMKAQDPKAEMTPAAKAKAPKPAKEGKASAEPGDRLPTTIEELKATKGGLVCYLFLAGKDKAEIAKELKTAFGLGDTQAMKIMRRITGRARFFRRVFELMTVK
jgi:hypothetical protein